MKAVCLCNHVTIIFQYEREEKMETKNVIRNVPVLDREVSLKTRISWCCKRHTPVFVQRSSTANIGRYLPKSYA